MRLHARVREAPAERACRTACGRRAGTARRAWPSTSGARLIDSTPPATNRSPSPASTAWQAATIAARPGRAQAVHGHAGHRLRQARQQRRHARDVAVVLAGLVGAAEVDVLDLGRVDAGALDRRRDRDAPRGRPGAPARARRRSARSACAPPRAARRASRALPPPRARPGRSRTRRSRPARRSRRRVCSRISLISSVVRPLRSAARKCIASSPSRPERDERGQRDGAAHAAVEPGPRPDAAPDVARDVVLEVGGEVGRALDGGVDVRVAEHLAPDLHAALVRRRRSCRLHCGPRRQMIEQEPVEDLGLLEVGEVAGTRQHAHRARRGCAARSPRLLGRRGRILAPGEHQRGRADRRQLGSGLPVARAPRSSPRTPRARPRSSSRGRRARAPGSSRCVRGVNQQPRARRPRSPPCPRPARWRLARASSRAGRSAPTCRPARAGRCARARASRATCRPRRRARGRRTRRAPARARRAVSSTPRASASTDRARAGCRGCCRVPGGRSAGRRSASRSAGTCGSHIASVVPSEFESTTTGASRRAVEARVRHRPEAGVVKKTVCPSPCRRMSKR